MRWRTVQRTAVPDEIIALTGGKKFLAEVLASRGITDLDQVRAFLDPDQYSPTSALEMPGMAGAVEMIEDAIQKSLKIGVWGDFDVDGQTATTVLVSALKMLGADVVYHIPVRALESHGVNLPNLAKMLDDRVQLVLTCDTGISAKEAALYAKERGVKFIITDHHDLPESLPPADAIINSKLLPQDHPLSSLPGVGVAYKLVEALFNKRGLSNELDQFLDLVALGIVADIAYLHGDTRYLLQRGLSVLKTTQRLGLQILFENAEISKSFISEEDISYSLAPRLNSLGRLGDANVIVDFLTSDQENRVRILANRLEGLNAQRKLLSNQVFQAASEQLERDRSLLHSSALVLTSKNWPAGVVGIVANRLVERFYKPTILLTVDEDGLARGSARSVPGCDISKAIAGCGDLLEGFGGHPMAAGLALHSNQIEPFRKCLSEEVDRQMGGGDYEPELVVDGVLELNEISLDLVEQVEALAPFGPGNPPLIFVSEHLKLVSHSVLGRSGEHLRLIVEDSGGDQQQVVWWQGAGWDLPSGQFDLAFAARKNVFRGQVQLQIELLDFRVVEREDDIQASPEIDLVDCRSVSDPLSDLTEKLSSNPNILVWSEGVEPLKVGGVGHHEAHPADVLVIWHAPPSASGFRHVIEVVRPKKIIFYGQDPGLDEFQPFILRLAGLSKFAIGQKDGVSNLDVFSSAMAHTKATVRLGLQWLESANKITVVEEDEKKIVIGPAQEAILDSSSPDIPFTQIAPLLKEAKSFRKYLADCTYTQLSEVICGFNNG